MSESEQAQPVFSIEKIYVKDLSLEIPNAPRIFLDQESPEIDLQLQSQSEKLDDGIWETVLTVTVTAKREDKTYFLVETRQAGIFQIRGIPEDEMEPVLQIACPNILFPYAREVVADMVNRASFPPIHLAPINFEGLYQQRLEQESQTAAANDGPGTQH